MNTAAYPDLASGKFIRIDSSEDPNAFIRLLENKLVFFLGSRSKANEDNVQTVYDDRRKTLFGSLLCGPAAELFYSLEAAIAWNEIKTVYRSIQWRENAVPIPKRSWKIEKTAQRKHKKLLTQKQIISWQGMAYAFWRLRAKTSEFECMKTSLHVGFLTPPELKQKAHQVLVKDPKEAWNTLQTLIINEETSLVISAEISGLKQSSSRTSADSTDSRFTNIQKPLNEINKMVKNNQINATYDPNNRKIEKDSTRFCTNCKKSGHTIKCFWSFKKKKFNEEKKFLSINWKKFILKITQTDKNRQIVTNRTQAIDPTFIEVVPTALTLQIAIVAEVTVTRELFALKQDLTRLTRCITHCSHAILQTNQISEPRKWDSK